MVSIRQFQTIQSGIRDISIFVFKNFLALLRDEDYLDEAMQKGMSECFFVRRTTIVAF